MNAGLEVLRRVHRALPAPLRAGSGGLIGFARSAQRAAGGRARSAQRAARVSTRTAATRLSGWRWWRSPDAPKPLWTQDSQVRAVFLTPHATGEGFEEIWRLRSRELVGALGSAGADVLALEFDAHAPAVLDEFDADFVIAANMNYFLAGAVGDDSLVGRIGRPATMLWDDPLGALALWLIWQRQGRLGWRNETPEAGDVLERFRTVLSASETQHFSWDSGHIAAVVELGLAPRASIEWHAISTFAPFLEQGRRGGIEPHIDVSFCGNVYENLVAESNFAAEPFFVELTDRITSRRLEHLGSSAWELLRSETEALPATERERWGLMPSRAEFWDYYLYAVWLALTTAVRIGLLTRIEQPVDVFGVFADPASQKLLERHPNLRYSGHAHHSTELPAIFAATKVNVCISNGLIYQGVPCKLVDCLASGGFALVDPKDDLVQLFGRDVDAIVFNDADELNTKVEYYLARPNERREIVETLRRIVEQHCGLEHLSRRIVDRRVTSV